jgi:hypothetical protein
MEREELRAAQAPLKERYAGDAEAAMVTLAASGELGEGVSCSVQTGRAIAEAGLHPASGGDREAPVGFSAIRLSFELDSDADGEQLDTLLKLTERYCVVFQTIASPPLLSATLETA